MSVEDFSEGNGRPAVALVRVWRGHEARTVARGIDVIDGDTVRIDVGGLGACGIILQPVIRGRIVNGLWVAVHSGAYFIDRLQSSH